MSNIVPKTHEQGQLGREGRRWAEVHAELSVFDGVKFGSSAASPDANALWLTEAGVLMFGDTAVALGSANTEDLRQIIDALVDENGEGLNSQLNFISEHFDTLKEIAEGLTAHVTAIANNATAIADNTTAIDVNTTAIDVNTTAIDVNTTAIGVNAASITAVKASITTLQGEVDANTDAIGVNAASISAINTSISNITSDVSSNTSNIGAINQRVPASPTAGNGAVFVNENGTHRTSSVSVLKTSSVLHHVVPTSTGLRVTLGTLSAPFDSVSIGPSTAVSRTLETVDGPGGPVLVESSTQAPYALFSESVSSSTISNAWNDNLVAIDGLGASARLRDAGLNIVKNQEGLVVGVNPRANSEVSLGADDRRFKSIFCDDLNASANSVIIGGVTISATTGGTLSVSGGTSLATTAFVANEIAGVTGGTGGLTALDTKFTNLTQTNATNISTNAASITSLQSDLSNLETLHASEINAATLSIRLLTQSLSSEQSVRGNADTQLGNRITALSLSLDNVISNVDSQALDSLTEVVSAFQAADSNLNTAITQLASDRASALTAHATANSASFSAINSSISALDTQVTANSNSIGTINGTLTDLDTAITANSNSIGALQTSLSALDTQVTANSNSIGTINGTLTDLDTAITANSNSIGTLQSGLSALDTQVTANSNSIGTINGTLTDLDTAITANSNSIGTLQSGLSALDTQVTANSNSIGTINGTLTGVQADVASNASSISALQTTVGGHTSSINDLQTTISGLSSGSQTTSTALAALDDRIDNMSRYTLGNTTEAYTSVTNANVISGATNIHHATILLDTAVAGKQDAFTLGTGLTLSAGELSIDGDFVSSSDIANMATIAYVDAAVASLVDSAPGTLDTLNELAAALGDDPNFATTVTNSIAAKQDPVSATGPITLTNATIGLDFSDSDFELVDSSLQLKAGVYATASSLTSLSNTVSARLDIKSTGSGLSLSGTGTLAVDFTISDYVTSASLSEDLADYVTSASLAQDLADYVTAASLAQDLGSYVTAASLAEDLGNYVTAASLAQDLGSYVTAASLAEDLGNYVTAASLAEDLGNYVTAASLAEDLGNYVTAASLAEDLGDYVTSASLTQDLADYVTAASLTQDLADYVTSASLTQDLASYVTAASLSEDLADYVTSASLTQDLASYVTAASLSEDLADYVTAASLAEDLASYVTAASLSEDLADYVTAASLAQDLGDYVTAASLAQELGSYVTAASLSEDLADYVTAASLSEDLADYVTAASLSEDLADYVTAASLAQDLGDYATAASLGALDTRVETLEDAGYITASDLVAGSSISISNTTISVSSALQNAVNTNSAKETYTNAKVDARIALQVGANLDLSSKDTDDLAEGSSNLYYTSTRATTDARGALSVTDNGGDGSLSYDSSTGVFSFTGPSSADVTQYLAAGTNLTLSGGTFSLSSLLTNIIVSGHILETFDHGDLDAHDSASDFGSVSSNLIMKSVDLGGLDNGSLI